MEPKTKNKKASSFEELGIVKDLCKACSRVGWNKPTEIQTKAIPLALAGRDVIGLAKTGSGKTAAYTLPMLQSLLREPRKLFGVILTPTRELAFQVKDHVQALGTKIGVKVAVITGGMDWKEEQLKLMAKPHIVVATPGRLLDHLRRTKGFTLEKVKYLVFDEADRILGVDLETHMKEILRVLPEERRTMLFSATMNKSAQKLERASLTNPVTVKVNEAFQTVDTLEQHMSLVPLQHKIASLTWFLHKAEALSTETSKTFIIFCNTRHSVLKVHKTVAQLSFKSIAIYGKMAQDKRMEALNKFKVKVKNILVATDVASRGLDIPGVDWVINFDIPLSVKDYIHRVGRTARAGKQGQSLTFTTQYDFKEFFGLEEKLSVKMKENRIPEDEVLLLYPSIQKAEKQSEAEIARMESQDDKDQAGGRKTKRSNRGVDNRGKRKRRKV